MAYKIAQETAEWLFVVQSRYMKKKQKTENWRNKVKKKDYESLGECISSDQVPAALIAEYFTDQKFHKWYKRKYL